jgi:calcineurin-like phosphoesterase family protein
MRFWTSDWHFNHVNIIEFADRPFHKSVFDVTPAHVGETLVPDTDAMNQALIDNTNDMVGPDDEIWFIGDVAMGSRSVSVPLFKQLRCRNLFLVPGNHDHVHRMFPKWAKHVPLYEDAGFTIMNSQETVQIAGQDVLVCHFPYFGDSHFDDRYMGLRPDDVGQWLIHGHTHSHEVLRGRQIHVGVDAWDMRPVSETQIEEIITAT